MGTEPLLHYNASDARRHFHAMIEEATRHERPVVIDPRDMDTTILLSRDQLLGALASYTFHTRIMPEEEDGGFSLWIEELALGEYGATLREARDALVASVRSSAVRFFRKWDFYRHLPDQASRYYFYLRIALANDDELKRMLYAPLPFASATEPVRERTGGA